MEEVKKALVDNLEFTGVLGQIKANIKASILRQLEQQNGKVHGKLFTWENPEASKIVQDPRGALCAELIKEFLEFY
jgi:hypothetical protein